MNLLRASVSCLVFAVVLAAEVSVVASLVPPDALTTERFNVFMLYAMGLAFLPLLIAVGLAAALIALLVTVAYLAARICWNLLSPRIQTQESPRRRMLRRLKELKRTKPERERSGQAIERDR